MSNGEVFAGIWADSFLAPGRGCKSHGAARRLPGQPKCDGRGPPGLRPSATINNGERITSVTLANDQMAIRWETQSAAL